MTILRRPIVLAAILLTAAVAALCAGSRHHGAPAPGPHGSASASPQTPPRPHTTTPSSPAPSPGAPSTGSDDVPAPSTTALTPSQRQCLTTARRFMSVFARPAAGTSSGHWWSRVRPYLTAAAAADFSGTDPRRVPFTHLTGPPVLAAPSTDGPITTVTVPTDAGVYQLEILHDVSGPGAHIASAAPLS